MLAGTQVHRLHAEDVIRLAERAHAAFPEIPLVGFDIIAANYGFSFEEQFDEARKAAYNFTERTQQYEL